MNIFLKLQLLLKARRIAKEIRFDKPDLEDVKIRIVPVESKGFYHHYIQRRDIPGPRTTSPSRRAPIQKPRACPFPQCWEERIVRHIMES